MSSDKSKCFLCKQAADEKVTNGMKENFPVESQKAKYDKKVA